MSAYFAHASEPRNIVPECDQLNPQPSLFQPATKRFDLSTFSGAVNA
jgi:hypothetical protein